MAEEADIIVAWNHGAIPASAKPAFTRPTRFINLPNPESGQNWTSVVTQYGPNPIRGIVQKYAPGVTPLRVALLGFSASCAGVAAVLKSADGGNIDVVYACDGIHTGYTDSSKPGGELNVTGLQPWLDFGKLAVGNDRLFVISHSSVVPSITDANGTRYYASTTETANWLWTTLTSNSDLYAAQPAVPEITVPPTQVNSSVNGPQRTVQYPAPPWKSLRRDDGLIIYGCANLDKYAGTTDHVYQAKAIMPAILAQVVAARWNAIDPKAPGQICFIGGPPAHLTDLFTLGASCAQSMVLPASYMQAATSNPLEPVTTAASAPSTPSRLWPWVLGAAGLGALWWFSSGRLLENPDGVTEFVGPLLPPRTSPLPFSVSYSGDVARVRYKTADDPHRLFELSVEPRESGGMWELRDPSGRSVSTGTIGEYGSLSNASGSALPQTVAKAERVFRSTGIWACTGPNRARWGVPLP